MKRTLFPCFALTAIALCSCGQTTYTGVYSFQLGKDKGVHAGAKMELLERDYFPSTSEGQAALGKTFRFTVEFQGGNEPVSSVSSSSSSSVQGGKAIDEGMPFNALLNLAYLLFGDGEAMIGYYKIGEDLGNGHHRLNFGFSPSPEVLELLAEIFTVPVSELGIEPELTELLIYSTISEKEVALAIPVSFDDLLMQVYWYGYDVYAKDGEFHIDPLPSPHAPGTHPTKEDVASINADTTFRDHHDTSFRDFYTVSLSLAKQQ